MKVGFQHIGNLHIVLGALLENLGCDVVLGSRPNKKTLEIGVKYAPEMVCLPFKVTLGDMFQNLDQGANTLAFIGGGDWSCRFGYYGRLQCSILKRCGLDFKSVFVSFEHTKSVLSEILDLNSKSWTVAIRSALRAVTLAWHKSRLLELTETLARKTRAIEMHQGDSTRLTKIILSDVEKENTVFGLRKMKKRIKELFSDVRVDNNIKPVKMLIVGESYCVIEPFVNFNLIEHLGKNNVLVEPFLTAHRWLFSHSLKKNEHPYLSKQDAMKLAKPFWSYGTGGEDQVSIGHALYAAQHDFDGIIHLMPFGCMPETAALPVFEMISKQYDIPFLNFSLDEHSSPTGFYTRIEAFLDCLQKRRFGAGNRVKLYSQNRR